jgi:hypothetical protein
MHQWFWQDLVLLLFLMALEPMLHFPARLKRLFPWMVCSFMSLKLLVVLSEKLT